MYTDKKKIKFFLIYKEIQNGAVAKLYMTNKPPHIWLNICAFPHILGSPSSYMTLQHLHSKFPYISGKLDFLFISVPPKTFTIHILYIRSHIPIPNPSWKLFSFDKGSEQTRIIHSTYLLLNNYLTKKIKSQILCIAKVEHQSLSNR